jgi:predicted metal-binding membrane protein
MNSGFGTAKPEGRAGLLSEWAFLGVSALLFIASAGGTFYWWSAMSDDMPMPDGLSLSSVWMRMPGQTWLGATSSFMQMWVVMMVAMMLPSLVPMLMRYRRSIRRLSTARLAGSTALAGAGYFCVWAAVGAAVYPLGVVVIAAEMRWFALARAELIATGIVLLLAGGVQLTAWKARQLRHCREVPVWAQSLSSDARSAWQYGLRLGMHCSLCCASFMIILLVTGMMDLGAIAIITAVITIERLVPRPERTARVAGVVVIVAGAFILARALSMI